MAAYVLESEHFWYGTLLSLGNNIKVIEPQILIDKIYKSSEDILKLYKQLWTRCPACRLVETQKQGLTANSS